MATTPTMTREVAYWKNQFARAKQIREVYERQWYMNLAFYFGRQYVNWAPATAASLTVQRLIEPASSRHRVRLVANKIQPIIRVELIKLCKEEPQFYAIPSTTEPSDVAAARVSEALVEFAIDDMLFNKKRRSATWWTILCGTAFLKTEIKAKNGDICFEPITPFHLYVPNVQLELIEEQPWVIHARAVAPEVVEATYGVKVAASSRIDGSSLDQKLMASLGIRATAQENEVKDFCNLMDIYVKPCKKYPDGAFLVIAEDQLIYAYEDKSKEPPVPVDNEDAPEGTSSGFWTQSDFPFAHGMYPFAKIDHIPAGRFYGMSAIEGLIPLQKEYNRTRSQIIESKNRMGKPQWTYQMGSLDPSKITSEPGLMIPIKPGFDPPRPVEVAQIPGYVIQELDRTLADMDDLSGQYEVSKGRTPPGVEAASAIAYLQEENDSRLYHTVASIEEAAQIVGFQVLSLINEYWDQNKIIEVVSVNNAIEAMQFKKANMKKNMDIRIEPGSMAPKSRAAKQAFITELIKLGIIPPEKGLGYLEMNETSRLYEELRIDSKSAQRENYLMSSIDVSKIPDVPDPNNPMGPPVSTGVPTNIWDNHPVHIYEHGSFLKSQQFEMLDQQHKDVLVAHYTEHLNKLGAMQNVGMGQSAGVSPGGNESNSLGQPAGAGTGADSSGGITGESVPQ